MSTAVTNLSTAEVILVQGLGPTMALMKVWADHTAPGNDLALTAKAVRERLNYGQHTMAIDDFAVTLPEIKRGDHFRHYKGGLYMVIGGSRHTETKERLIHYVLSASPEDETSPDVRDEIWARPLGMFLEDVTLDGGLTWIPRFKKEL